MPGREPRGWATPARVALHAVTAVTAVVGLVVAVATGGSAAGNAPRAARADAFTPTSTTGAPPPTTGAPAATTAPATSTTLPVVTSSSPPITAVAPPVSSTTTTTTTAAPGPSASAVTAQLEAKIVPHVVAVYAQPGGAPSFGLYNTTELGSPRVFPVVQVGGDWLLVQLPTRPNGSEGWIHASDATLTTSDDLVTVDLSTRSLTWFHDGVIALTSRVGIGAPSSPTPPGRFFVTDVLPEPAGGVYGAWLIALNAHSDTFTEFEGGDARIAIHGTNDPGSVGAAVSSGCLRAAPAPLARLAAGLPLGTPVIVSA